MEIWEATGSANGLREASGTLLGSEKPELADIVTAVLWSTMADRFGVIAALLAQNAPRVAALTRRMQATPELARLAEESRRKFGDTYCGGEIEKSLRAVAA
jgi:glutathione S-transferase